MLSLVIKGDEMDKYIGVKVIEAKPLTRGEYNTYRGWEIPSNEDPADPGYLVVYPDGYESWCPKTQFEEANRIMTGLPFGHAIEAARKGLKIARKGWNGKGMFVVMQPAMELPPFNTQGTARKVNDRTAKFIGEDAPLDCPPYFCMYSADKKWICGWLASQTDMLADDWEVL